MPKLTDPQVIVFDVIFNPETGEIEKIIKCRPHLHAGFLAYDRRHIVSMKKTIANFYRKHYGDEKPFVCAIPAVHHPQIHREYIGIFDDVLTEQQVAEKYQGQDIILTCPLGTRGIDNLGPEAIQLDDHEINSLATRDKLALDFVFRGTRYYPKSCHANLYFEERVESRSNLQRLLVQSYSEYFIFKPDGAHGGHGILLIKRESVLDAFEELSNPNLSFDRYCEYFFDTESSLTKDLSIGYTYWKKMHGFNNDYMPFIAQEFCEIPEVVINKQPRRAIVRSVVSVANGGLELLGAWYHGASAAVSDQLTHENAIISPEETREYVDQCSRLLTVEECASFQESIKNVVKAFFYQAMLLPQNSFSTFEGMIKLPRVDFGLARAAVLSRYTRVSTINDTPPPSMTLCRELVARNLIQPHTQPYGFLARCRYQEALIYARQHEHDEVVETLLSDRYRSDLGLEQTVFRRNQNEFFRARAQRSFCHNKQHFRKRLE